jgi:hypothetical protein
MHSFHDLDVLRDLVTDRESQLARSSRLAARRSNSAVRRSFGRHLMRLGAWLAGETPIRTAEATQTHLSSPAESVLTGGFGAL